MNQTWHSYSHYINSTHVHCLEEAEPSSQMAKNSKEGNTATSKNFCSNTVFGTREQLGINVNALKTKKENNSYFLVAEL